MLRFWGLANMQHQACSAARGQECRTLVRNSKTPSCHAWLMNKWHSKPGKRDVTDPRQTRFMKWFINQPDVAGPNHKRIFLNFSQETLWILHQRPTHLACLAGHWLDVLLIHRVNAGPIDTIEGLKLVAAHPEAVESRIGECSAERPVARRAGPAGHAVTQQNLRLTRSSGAAASKPSHQAKVPSNGSLF